MMTLVNGKFFKDGELCPLEFGNKDQLSLINKANAAKDKGLDPTFVIENDKWVGISTTCVCGSTVIFNWLHEYDAHDSTDKKINCPGCKFKYQVLEDDWGLLYFKIIN